MIKMSLITTGLFNAWSSLRTTGLFNTWCYTVNSPFTVWDMLMGESAESISIWYSDNWLERHEDINSHGKVDWNQPVFYSSKSQPFRYKSIVLLGFDPGWRLVSLGMSYGGMFSRHWSPVVCNYCVLAGYIFGGLVGSRIGIVFVAGWYFLAYK